MTIKPGDMLPETIFKIMGEDGPEEVTTREFFTGKRIVVFAVPGAFTPTCHMNHLPGFLTHHEDIKAKGVDDIAVISVNDVWVMHQWAKETDGKGKIHFLADGSAAFTKAVGLDIDLGAAGMGVRSQRYSMIVDNGTVTDLNIEEKPGVADLSGSAAILKKLERTPLKVSA